MELTTVLVHPHRRPVDRLPRPRGLRLRRRHAAARPRHAARTPTTPRSAAASCSTRSARSGTATRSGCSPPVARPSPPSRTGTRRMFSGVLPAAAAHPRRAHRAQPRLRVPRTSGTTTGGAALGPAPSSSGRSCRPCSWGVALTNIVRGVPIDASQRVHRQPVHPAQPGRRCSAGSSPCSPVPHPRRASSSRSRPTGRSAHDARDFATRAGVVAAVLAVALLVWLGLSKAATSARGSRPSSPRSPCSARSSANLRAGGLGVRRHVRHHRDGGRDATSSLLFPNVMPARPTAACSLTIDQRVEHPPTRCKIMTVVALVFTPIVLLYQGWTYWVFRKRIAVQHIPDAVSRRTDDDPTAPCQPTAYAVKPFDPRLLRACPQARRPVRRRSPRLGVAQGVATIGYGLRPVGARRRGRRRATARRPRALARRRSPCARAARLGRRAGAPPGPASTVSAALRARSSPAGCARPPTPGPTPGPPPLRHRGVRAVEPYAARFLPALVTAAVVPVLADRRRSPSSTGRARSSSCSPCRCCPLFAALIGQTTQEATAAPVAGAGRPGRPLPRRRARAADPRRLRPGRAPGRHDRRGERAAPAAPRWGPCGWRSCPRPRSSCSRRSRSPSSPSSVGLRLPHGSIGPARRAASPSCLRPRRTGRSGGSARSSTRPPTGAEALDAILAELECPSGPDVAGTTGNGGGPARRGDLPAPWPRHTSARPSSSFARRARPHRRHRTVRRRQVDAARARRRAAAARERDRRRTGRAPGDPAPVPRDRLGPREPHTRRIRRATTDRLWAALRLVRLEGVVAGLPQGLETPIGDDGFGLSAGQRARLALARATLSAAPVLLLDEPTAHLDADAVEAIHRAVTEIATQRVVIAVTHQADFAAAADQLVQLQPDGPDTSNGSGSRTRQADSAAHDDVRPDVQPQGAEGRSR